MGGVAKTVGRVVGAVAGAVIGFFVGGPLGAVAGALIGFGTADVVAAMINPGFDVPDTSLADARQQNQGVTVNKQGSDIKIPVVYGERRMGGIRVFVSTEGADNQFLHIVLAIAEGEIERFSEIYCDDQLAWTGSSVHGGRYDANVGKFAGLMTFETYHGREDQKFNNSGTHITLGVGGWTANHRLRGIAYIAFKLRWLKIERSEDQDKTPWGNIPNITVVMRGRRVASSATFADTVDRSVAYADETVAWSQNPVDCLLDYLRNPLYGKGLTNAKINFKSFKDEARRWLVSSDGVTPLTGDSYQQCNAV